jgi:hypothetical protein
MTDQTPTPTQNPLPRWATARQTDGSPSPGSPLDRQFAAFVGPRWATYRRKFTPFFADARFQPTWNWAAALSSLFGPVWFLYRKLYIPAIVFWLLPNIALGLLWRGGAIRPEEMFDLNSPVGQDFRLVAAGVVMSMVILAGGTANFLLFRRARAAIQLVSTRGAGEEQALSLLARLGRVSITALVIGLLANLLMASAQLGGR